MTSSSMCIPKGGYRRNRLCVGDLEVGGTEQRELEPGDGLAETSWRPPGDGLSFMQTFHIQEAAKRES